MKWLRRYDFTKKINDDTTEYYTYQNKRILIILEPCLNGFDIYVYSNKTKKQIDKVCTSINECMTSFLTDQEIDKEIIWTESMKIANKLLHTY